MFSARSVGAVTALALSYDHTYVASGHASGHIQLFDVQSPKTPARFVPPTTLEAVASGREEGHLVGSRIVSVGFIAGRHTALVSADDSGLAFYHSLGKVLFVEATDTLRILGKYPDEEVQETPVPGLSHVYHPFRRRRMRKAHTILSMSPLPLGPSPHCTDTYQLIALLTPAKLVIVGLKPTPKTWYRAHREADEDSLVKSRYKGILSWFPSIASGTIVQPTHQLNGKARTSQPEGMLPMLVYGWGNTLHLVRVSESKSPQDIKNPKTGKVNKVEVGRIVILEAGKWTVGGDVLALQWLNANQILVLTSVTLEVYDIHTFRLVEHVLFDAWTLVSPLLAHTTNGSVSYTDAVTEVSHSVRVYKGKIFLLGQHEVLVGTLLTWADRILSFVENGDFLSAIELTRSYYIGEAPGNRNGLPDKPEELREVVGEKMRELMAASARYAFSEDRMTDGTHITPDGRGVDRTSLFENLVATCARACLALGDFDFLFEELYSYYDEYGIPKIFLEQLEPFVLDGRIHYVPPRITQRIVGLHQENGRPDLAERLIWHIEPECLDINQAITLCQQYQLYDALIYVYTRALKDYVSPMVELFALIRSVQRYRKTRAEASPTSKQLINNSTIEDTAINAYKIFPYLANVLTGLTYPSEEPLPEAEAISAQNDVYKFLFFGRSSVWPEGESGKLVLTSDEENGVEPTYPYARLLVRFDSEAFLHTLDLAFEDHYLNDETRGVSRLVIVKILMEILSTPALPQTDRTFINIFIARNVPKYPQFIQMTPSALHNILIGLAKDEDESTREDRQLAAEFLLSAYTPHESDRILTLFMEAGFWRILRTWHRHDKQWAPLITAYMNDRDLGTPELFDSLSEVLRTASKGKKSGLQTDVIDTVSNSLPLLLRNGVASTAGLIDTYMPTLHEEAWKVLQERPASEQLCYLRELLGSPQSFDEGGPYSHYQRTGPSERVPFHMRQEYISLLCELQPHSIITELRYFPPELLDWKEVVKICEAHNALDAVVWSLDWRGDTQAALSKTDSFLEHLASDLSGFLVDTGVEAEVSIDRCLSKLHSLESTAVEICLRRSRPSDQAQIALPLEDIWFQLLSSQMNCVHRVAIVLPASESPGPLAGRVMDSLRASIQETFSALMSASSSKVVSFPRLFKRLVDAGRINHVSQGAQYNEFRTILTGMLESYRSDGEMLVITQHLMARDMFESVEELAKARSRGWAPSRRVCTICRERLCGHEKSQVSEDEEEQEAGIVVSRTGAIYHKSCFESEDTNTI
ncbi:Golgi CORVET complex core vacuolar protein 8-domain-containing protein [Irpex rosettiformis]|uniref:Golgi CORVET complex core vacuolar protein 8-domain-containing protein n=1 Tax=Irpex rosettiformis TaxID=378272 RepID=A0ACB8TS95_9APHY|nr:Golgi CORVET complex core vacuolar protein 8-domain-containing protein [Irpex rosettiformis]